MNTSVLLQAGLHGHVHDQTFCFSVSGYMWARAGCGVCTGGLVYEILGISLTKLMAGKYTDNLALTSPIHFTLATSRKSSTKTFSMSSIDM